MDKPPDPKSGASANSATPAKLPCIILKYRGQTVKNNNGRNVFAKTNKQQ